MPTKAQTPARMMAKGMNQDIVLESDGVICSPVVVVGDGQTGSGFD